MELLLELLEFNETIDFALILTYITLCFGLFLFLVAFFTARDALQRYESLEWAIFWFVCILIMNFLGLILYMLVRPDGGERPFFNQSGGVNVPVVNFTGKDGEILLGLELKIKNAELTDHVRDMLIDIDWDSKDPKKRITTESIKQESIEVKKEINRMNKIFSTFEKSSEQLLRSLNNSGKSLKKKKSNKDKSSEKKKENRQVKKNQKKKSANKN